MNNEKFKGKDLGFLFIYILIMVLQIPSIILYLVNSNTSDSFLLFFGYFILFLVSIFMYRKEISNGIKSLKGRYIKLILFSILIGIFVIVLSGIVNSFFGVSETTNQKVIDDTIVENAKLVFFPIVIFGPIVEEIVYRNILIGKIVNGIFKQNKERNVFSKILYYITVFVIAVISMVIFSFMHTGFSNQIVVYLPIALGITIVYFKYNRNFVASFIFHLMWNGFAFFAGM